MISKGQHALQFGTHGVDVLDTLTELYDKDDLSHEFFNIVCSSINKTFVYLNDDGSIIPKTSL
jgi:hypothetical protein